MSQKSHQCAELPGCRRQHPRTSGRGCRLMTPTTRLIVLISSPAIRQISLTLGYCTVQLRWASAGAPKKSRYCVAPAPTFTTGRGSASQPVFGGTRGAAAPTSGLGRRQFLACVSGTMPALCALGLPPQAPPRWCDRTTALLK